MFAFRMQRSLRTGVDLTALAIGGCAPSDHAPTATAGAKTLLSVAQAQASAKRGPTADDYVRGNPMGWTGQAHNRFLVEALLKTVNLKSPAKRCEAIEKVLREGSWLGADAKRFSPEARRRLADEAVAQYPGCQSYEGKGEVRKAAYRKAMMSISDITPYTDAIMQAIPSAKSSNELAATVSAITDNAARVLSGDDLQNVYAAGAFTVSSAQYWEANGDWQVDAMASGGMADCIAATMSTDACVYASRGPAKRPTLPTFQLAAVRMPMASAAAFCPYKWNGWTVTAADLGGFMGGLMTVSVGGGVFVGAVASVSSFTAEAGREVYCRITHAQ
jgi:hypothetical protein